MISVEHHRTIQWIHALNLDKTWWLAAYVDLHLNRALLLSSSRSGGFLDVYVHGGEYGMGRTDSYDDINGYLLDNPRSTLLEVWNGSTNS